MSQFVCDNVKKSYGGKVVIEHLNLTLESGRIYGLLGRNGAGKTTLLSMMSNQAPVTDGSITLDGENIWENPRALSRIFFSRELNIVTNSGLGNFTAKDYFKTAAVFLPDWDQKLADELTAKFQLDTRSKLSKLSKGMLSMVTIVTAMASKAEFTFLDEPLAGLDLLARDQFCKMVLSEYTDTGRTFVISTHIIEEATDIMEEVIMLNGGKILMKENTQDILDRAVSVSGLAQQVDGATARFKCYGAKTEGRSKTVAVLLPKGQHIKGSFDVTVEPIDMNQLFIALCGEEV